MRRGLRGRDDSKRTTLVGRVGFIAKQQKQPSSRNFGKEVRIAPDSSKCQYLNARDFGTNTLCDSPLRVFASSASRRSTPIRITLPHQPILSILCVLCPSAPLRLTESVCNANLLPYPFVLAPSTSAGAVSSLSLTRVGISTAFMPPFSLSFCTHTAAMRPSAARVPSSFRTRKR
jgi:hypothetical protein